MAICKIINNPYIESCCLVSVDITGDTQKTLTFTLENGDVITSAFTDNNTTYTLAYNNGNLIFTPSTGSPTTIPLASFISGDSGNIISLGSDGGFFADDVTTTIINNPAGHRIATYINEDSIAFDINETITSITGATLGADNVLTINYRNETGVSAATTVNLSTLAADVKVLSLQYDAATNTIQITNTDGTTNSVVLTDIIDVITHTLTMTGNTLESTVNGISDSVDVITSASLSKIGTDLVMSVNGVQASIPISSIADGSETKLTAGTNVSVVGDGTTANPYIISSIDTDTTYTASISGNIITLTGSDGSIQTINLPAATVPDGSETKINPGTGISVLGSGTIADPYVVSSTVIDTNTTYTFAVSGTNIIATDSLGASTTLPIPCACDGAETKLNAGTGISVTGSGTIASPYLITNTVADTNTTYTLALNSTDLIFTDSLGATTTIPIPCTCTGIETKLSQGTNITITGTGTTLDPYVISSVGGGTGGDGSETKVTAGTGIAVSGLGTIASPYVVTSTVNDTNTTYTLAINDYNLDLIDSSSGVTSVQLPQPDGSETVVTAGTNVTISGSGTTADPYVINSIGGGTTADGSETKINVGTGLSITGNGTTASPYLLTNTVVDTDTNTTYSLSVSGTNVSLNGSDGSVSTIALPTGTTDTNTTYTLALSGNNLVFTGSDGVVTNLAIPCTCTGAETKLTAGSSISITGTGTTADPYVVNNTATPADGSETKINVGAGLTLSGSGTTASPYVLTNTVTDTNTTYTTSISGNVITLTGSDGSTQTINLPQPDGSETKVTAGTGTTVTGTGTTADPYVVSATGASSTIVTSATPDITITGDGSVARPYVLDTPIRKYVARIESVNNVLTATEVYDTIGVDSPSWSVTDATIYPGLFKTSSTGYQFDPAKTNVQVTSAANWTGLSVGGAAGSATISTNGLEGATTGPYLYLGVSNGDIYAPRVPGPSTDENLAFQNGVTTFAVYYEVTVYP